MKRKNILLWIALLVIIDQVIKIIINTYFLDIRFNIIPSLFEFYPKFNDKYSYICVLFSLNIGLLVHVIVISAIGITLLFMYNYLKKILINTKLLDFMFVFSMSGIICALIGIVIWTRGTLDYIYLKPLFIFDLKDLYLNVFGCLFLVFFYKNRMQLKAAKGRDLIIYVKNYFGFLRKS
ncbi:MAG: signal peptidase II [Prevotellaceae bacterium]|jgi:hypothetical protein|nr:signal peptidase II [Prevotellaceae bacterium]